MTLPALAADFGKTVVAWQRRHGRHTLPWQNTRDPYRVWLSEVMLQQTQVTTVLGYYERFLARWPRVTDLAAASLDDVLAQWAGLGYYSRARNLHACARAVAELHGGEFPQSAAGLQTLPGIGRSTAAAIAAFCFGERVAILDGNVKRVLSRVLGFADDLAEARHEKRLWQIAQDLLPRDDGDLADHMARHTQGLMDLGATVCTPRKPACLVCPWATPCVARAQGRPEAYPVKTRKTKRHARSNALLWLQHGDQVWLVQRPHSGVWAGLWTLPEYEDAAALDGLHAGWPGQGGWLPAFTHVLTHRDWTLQPLRWQLPASLAASQRQAIEERLPAGRWFALDQALALGLPAPVRKLLAGG